MQNIMHIIAARHISAYNIHHRLSVCLIQNAQCVPVAGLASSDKFGYIRHTYNLLMPYILKNCIDTCNFPP